MDGIRLPFRCFDPGPVLLDPRAYIAVPSPAEILAEAEQLAVEVLGQAEAEHLSAAVAEQLAAAAAEQLAAKFEGHDPAEPTAVVVEHDPHNADGPRV